MGAGYYEDPRLWHRERYEEADEQRRFALAASLLPHDTQSLLDVGCGNGAFLRLLESTTQITVTGIEPAAAARAAAICRAPVVMGAADEIPYEDGAFDAVTALEVLEHLPHGVYERALRELPRVAARSLIVSVPYRERRAFITCPYCGCRFHPYYHMRRFDRRMLTVLFPSMRLVRTKLVYVKDFAGGNVLRAVYRRLAKATWFPPTSICPQCGLRGDQAGDAPEATPQQLGGAFASRFKRRIPTTRRPKWAVAVYEHVETKPVAGCRSRVS